MKTLQKEIAELKAHNSFVQVYLLDRYKDDLKGLALHCHGPMYLEWGLTPESVRQSLNNNIKICEEKIANLEAQVNG